MEPDILQGKAGKETLQKRQDRLVSFFDAIVAVGITMIVMGIALPEASMEPWELVAYIGSEVTVYLVSFIALAELWRVHHAIFTHFEGVAAEEVTNVHIALMFFVTIFPFLTRFMNAYQNVMEIRVLYVSSYVVMNSLMVLIVYLANRRYVQNQLEKEDKIKKWIPLMFAGGKSEGGLDGKMSEFTKYSAMFQKGNFSGKQVDKENAFILDEGLKESLKAMGVWEEEDPNLKKAGSIQAMISISFNFVSVTLSVILLMVNPLFCYIVFLAKFVLEAIGKRIVEIVLMPSQSGQVSPEEKQALTASAQIPPGVGQGSETVPLSKDWMELLKEERRRREQERRRVSERMQKEREDARRARERMHTERERAKEDSKRTREDRGKAQKKQGVQETAHECKDNDDMRGKGQGCGRGQGL